MGQRGWHRDQCSQTEFDGSKHQLSRGRKLGEWATWEINLRSPSCTLCGRRGLFWEGWSNPLPASDGTGAVTQQEGGELQTALKLGHKGLQDFVASPQAVILTSERRRACGELIDGSGEEERRVKKTKKTKK